MRQNKTRLYLMLIAILGVFFIMGCPLTPSPDTTAPTVSSTVPANSATGVAVGSSITATFSEAMDPATITSATFTLNHGATAVAGTVSYGGTTATFNPSSSLLSMTAYTATITTGAKDAEGNALAANKVWSFTTADSAAPTVALTNPANLATGVAFNANILATFSEAMDSGTITTTTFTLKQGVTTVPGGVAYTGTTATFNPTADLTADTIYTATITMGAEDVGGNALASNKVWTFRTGLAADTTPPTVTSTIPVNSATVVPINSNVTATFSEAMDPTTLTTTTFTLMQGATPVTGTVTYSGSTATFNPTANLAASTVYTATITTGAKDLADNALAVNKVWSFTTGTVAVLLDPVSLGQTSNFAILAGYAVTYIPPSTPSLDIDGDVGISPAAQSFIAGFAETLVGDHATSPYVTGFIYGADMAVPTPAMLTQAKGDLTIAYNDAAARTPVPTGTFLNPGDGILDGLNLVPGLYKFTSEAEANTGFTLTGSANDVWIFQIATSLVIGNGVQVTLAGGAQAKNIFWQVGTQATLGTTVLFHGTIMADASITLNTGATLNGRALAFTGTVALDQAFITVPTP